jgi:hypothetical protein
MPFLTFPLSGPLNLGGSSRSENLTRVTLIARVDPILIAVFTSKMKDEEDVST